MRRELKTKDVMGADIIIASTAAVKFKCAASSRPSLRLAQVSGEPRMSGPDNSRNYRDFVSSCFTAIREISEAVSRDPKHDVAGDIAHRLARNQETFARARASHVPPSGRPKKGNNRKKPGVAKDLGSRQTSVTQASVSDTDERPSKAQKTAEGKFAPTLTNDAVPTDPKASDISGGFSPKKRKGDTKTTVTEHTPESYYAPDANRFLESFTFTRVILDEYSFKDHEVETFVERAIASSKWLLSGTPPLTKLSWVCRTASMLNVHVARIEPALPSHLHEITEGPSASDMSASEAYRALRQLKTTTFAHERHQQGLEFVRQFARRNPAVYNGGFKVIRKVVFVPRDTPAIAHYFRLQQCLFAARWDVQGLSQDGNELLKPVVNLGKSTSPQGPKESRAQKAWIQDESTDGRLNAAIQALLMHATLPSIVFHPPSKAGEPGATVSNPLSRLLQDAERSYLRLCSTLKSQFDRLMFLVAQFPQRVINGTSAHNDASDGDDEGDSVEDEAEEDLDPTVEEVQTPVEQGKKRNGDQSREARERKFRQARGYLDSLVNDLVFKKEKSIGGRELLTLLRETLLDGRCNDPMMDRRENWTEERWQRRSGGPGTSHLVDWYPDISQRLPKMSDEELKLVYQDCACLLGHTLPENFDTIPLSERQHATRKIIQAAQVRRREQFAEDEVEGKSGLTKGSDGLLTLRMGARRIGLKCLPDDTIEKLEDLHNKHRRGRCPDKFWEFGLGLTSRFPIIGMIRHLRGTDVEEGLEDLTWTSQSVTAGAYEKIPEAFHRYRFLLTVSSLSRTVLDGRICDGCGRTGVTADKMHLAIDCSHGFCDDCVTRKNVTDNVGLLWCGLCREEGEARMMLDERPSPGMFCHGCRETEIKAPSDAYVLATCGHLLCLRCIKNLYDNPPEKIDGSPDLPRCDVHGCNYPLLENEIRGDKLITNAENAPLVQLGPGGKLQRMIKIVSAAKKKAEKALVFVPYVQQMAMVEQCLADAGFSVMRTDNNRPAEVLTGFQSGSGDVLLQLLNSPESAGSNLTIANHIIFVGPHFTRDQRGWDMVVGQAVGRCVRPGQTKDVQVYHLVAENSLDVDVLEHHLKRRLQPGANDEVDLSVPVPEGDTAVDGQRASERGSLLQAAELDMLFRKVADYNDTENLH